MFPHNILPYVVLTLLSIPSLCFAITGFTISGARPAGLAGAFVAVADDANSPLTNPAGMSLLNRPAWTSYYTRLYGVEGLDYLMTSGVLPTRLGHLGLSYTSFGGDLYRESTLGLSYSRVLFSRLLLGVTTRAMMLSIKRYGQIRTTKFDAGVVLRLPGYFRFGVMAGSINRPHITEGEAQAPRIIHAGLSRASPRILISTQVDYVDGETTFRIGQEFQLTPRLVIRNGIVTAPSMIFAGLGVRLQPFEMSYAVSSHPTLGLTHQVSVSVSFDQKGEKP